MVAQSIVRAPQACQSHAEIAESGGQAERELGIFRGAGHQVFADC